MQSQACPSPPAALLQATFTLRSSAAIANPPPAPQSIQWIGDASKMSSYEETCSRPSAKPPLACETRVSKPTMATTLLPALRHSRLLCLPNGMPHLQGPSVDSIAVATHSVAFLPGGPRVDQTGLRWRGRQLILTQNFPRDNFLRPMPCLNVSECAVMTG
jgi:hypothetical protein